MENFFGFWIRNLKKHLFLFFLLTIFNLFGIDPNLDPKNYHVGAQPLTASQIAHIEKNWPQVLGVRPNKYGAARIQEHLKRQGITLGGMEVASNNQDEFITNKNSNTNNLNAQSYLQSVALLPSVNNSQLPCFPPIGDQQQLGACVGWSTTYYQATHEYGLLNGINNKTSSTNILSPKWTYNMLNFGQDGGAFPQDAYSLLATNGATSIVNFPYDTNYREWDLKTQDWISALSYRMNNPVFMNINGPTDINTVKQILNNGHVVTFVTFAYSWQMTKVSADPSQPNNPYAGQNAISWMNGTSGGHQTTIVGYDDNVWIDINGNGQVDSGEKGAFLIANSWGTGWANNGYVWISYDAFFSTSMVPNGPTTNRQPIAQMLFSITPKQASYTPKAIAKFSLSQASRNELKVSLGSSSTGAAAPTQTFQSKALNQDGGAYAFDGQNPTLETATFALDTTDLLSATNVPQKYYLIVADMAAGNNTTLNSYSIVDLTNNNEVPFTGTPITFDNSTIQPSVVFQQTVNPVKPTINITSPANLSTINGTVAITAQVNGNVNVKNVDFYIDSTLIGIDLTTPYGVSLDTTKVTNGQHNLVAVVYDESGNSASNTITITVQNSNFTNFPSYLTYQQNMNSEWADGAQYCATLKNTGTRSITDLKIKISAPITNISFCNATVVASDNQSVTIDLASTTKPIVPGAVISFNYIIHPSTAPRVNFVSATQV